MTDNNAPHHKLYEALAAEIREYLEGFGARHSHGYTPEQTKAVVEFTYEQVKRYLPLLKGITESQMIRYLFRTFEDNWNRFRQEPSRMLIRYSQAAAKIRDAEIKAALERGIHET